MSIKNWIPYLILMLIAVLSDAILYLLTIDG